MALSNRDRVGKALEAAGAALGPYVDRRMTRRSPMGGNWTASYAGENLGSDVSILINVILDNWQGVFRDELRSNGRNFVGEVKEWRNKWAHAEAFSHDDAYRALDSIERLLALTDAPQVQEVGESKSAIMRARYDAEAKGAVPKPQALFSEAPAGLRPWRDVVIPHEDVARGKYELAEFAANLYQVAAGKGLPEYTEPVEFFRRTYLTQGLHTMLGGALRRIAGEGGDAVVNLQTNFGGGKTHSMIALYHLFSGLSPAEFPQEVQELLAGAGVKELPQVSRAVLVGTQMAPGQPDVKPDGTEVRTIWGEIAWRLGGRDLFELVAEADRTATNPGAAMEDVLRLAAPCLVLVDEWVAYARQLVETRELLPAGLFETQFSFAQTLCDAAVAVPGALLVVSLPVSDDPARPGITPIGSAAEVGGPAGQEAARRLGNVIGRTEASWRPASAEESFEIVRRRLFQPIGADQMKHRDATARSFAEFYRTQAAEFPAEARDTAYRERIKRAYPIHPELFARLYEDWSALEGFQRTRGVLRLMAAVISYLWSEGDKSPLILPSSVPLDNAAVQGELIRNLDHAWQPIIDTDIDGPSAVSREVDRNPSLGRYQAGRRAARSVFLASAPRHGSPNLGVELQRVKLACAVPGESVATYTDALNHLTDRSSYLYVEGARYWYGTQASVARRARDLVEQYLSTRLDEVHAKIVERLRKMTGDRGEFTGVHICPPSPGEVPDVAECRLVLLAPDAPHVNRDESSLAFVAARAILEQRAAGARQFRNMLLFLAADQRRLAELERGVAEHLAWSDIHDRWEELGLDAYGRNQAQAKRAEADRAVELRLAETYHWALIPHQPDPTGPIEWETVKTDGEGGIAARASRKLLNTGSFSTAYSAELLRGLLSDEDRLAALWVDGYVPVNEIWDAFARYVYLPRLRNIDVLVATVANGPNSVTWRQHGFAVAEGRDGSADRFVGLVVGGVVAHSVGTSLVVQPDLALVQLDEEASHTATIAGEAEAGAGTGERSGGGTAAVDDRLRRFYAVARLDPERYQRDFAKLAQEIVANLAGQLNTDLELTVEITAKNPDGFADGVVRSVGENARTLKLDQFGFETE